MKLNVSLPEEDIEFIDAFGQAQQLASRSAVLRTAVRLLRAVELGADDEEGGTDGRS